MTDMTRFLYVAATLFMTVCVLGSCLSDSSDSVETNGDCAIMAVTMGTLKRTVYTTTAAGNDTSYVVSVAGSAYPMYVDQLSHEIYNPDSLPQNTDVSKVVLSNIAADGSVFYKDADGMEYYFSNKDSIDFTNPVLFTCYSPDGTQSQTYRVRINVHKSNSEMFTWTTLADSVAAFADVSAMKVFLCGDMLTVFADKGGQPTLMQAVVSEPSEWTVSAIEGVTGFAPDKVYLFDGRYYCTADGRVMRSADGKAWTAADTPRAAHAIVAVGRDAIYALADGGMMYSADGEVWRDDGVDGDLSAFPTVNTCSAWSDMAFNSNFSFVLAAGLSGGECRVWRKVVDINGNDSEAWSEFPQGENGSNVFPALPQGVMLAYDSKLLYAGLEDGSMGNFYVSSDGGRNWMEQRSTYNAPGDMECDAFGMVADDDNFVWVVSAPGGKIVKGRLNRLSYEENPRIFK